VACLHFPHSLSRLLRVQDVLSVFPRGTCVYPRDAEEPVLASPTAAMQFRPADGSGLTRVMTNPFPLRQFFNRRMQPPQLLLMAPNTAERFYRSDPI
jgi:hypothetical protein